MNIFHKVALQGLKKNRTRTLVTIIGVALASALITAVSTFGISLINYLTKGAAEKYGHWQVEFSDTSASFLQEQAADSRVEQAVSFENIGYAMLDGGKNPDKPYLFLAGFDQETFEEVPVNLLSGRFPENSGEILASSHILANGGVKMSVGDTLTLAVGTRQDKEGALNQHNPYHSGEETLSGTVEKTYTVVGICERPVFEERSAPGYTMITIADGAEETGSFSTFVTLKNPFQVRSYADHAAPDHAYVLNDQVLRFMGLSSDRLFTMLLYTVGVIVMAIIMTGSVFLIYNAFHISLNERIHQFGILMSVGATEKQLRNSVLFEGLVIGAAGIPLGVLAGLGGMGFVLRIVNKNFVNLMYDNVSLELIISIPVIAVAALISLITILISAYIPARKAAGTPVMECIRQTNEIKVETRTVKTSGFAERIYGLEGTLALKNFKRNKGRYRSIVLSLTLSIVLFVTVNAFVIDMKQIAEEAVVFTTYDIGLDTHEMGDGEMLEIYDKLKNAEGVYESSYQEVMAYSCSAERGVLSGAFQEIADLQPADERAELSLDLQFLDDEAYGKLIKEAGLPEQEYTGENAGLIAVAKILDNDQEKQEADDFSDMFQSGSMDITICPKTESGILTEQEKHVKLTFVDLIIPDIVPNLENTETTSDPYVFTVLAPYSLKERFETPDVRVISKGLTFRSETPTLSARKMQTILTEEKITSNYQLWNVSKMLDDNNNMIFIANVFAYTFVVMISLIAVANVFNTISTNIKMRRRELAMLRSVGMSEHDFQKMMNFECVFYGMRALLWGLPMAGFLSWVIYRGMIRGSIEGSIKIRFVMPWGSMLISIISVLLIVFVTMMYSTSKIKKENIIEALRDEMT